MVRLDFTGVEAEDRGYGLEIKGIGGLEEIISKALGTKSSDGRQEAGYGDEITKEGLKRFKSNNCDITVIITDHPQKISIENDEYEWGDYKSFKEELEARENEFTKKAKKADPEE